MSTRPGTLLLTLVALLSGGAIYLTINGSTSQAGPRTGNASAAASAAATAGDRSAGGASAQPGALEDALGDDLVGDAPLTETADELLQVAYEAASAMPLMPHVKNRSRSQEQVVVACLELGQPARARGYADGIDNWRRGAAYADIAFFHAREGDGALVPRYVALAQDVVERLERGELIHEVESSQAWRVDRIRAKIARTLRFVGQDAEAAKFEEGLEESEIGQVAAVKAMLLDEADFARQVEALDGLTDAGTLQHVRSALEAAAWLFDRFYADVERRELVREKIEDHLNKVPAQVAIELLLQLAGFALEHADRATALDLTLHAHRVMSSVEWDAEFGVPLTARLAEMRWNAGDAQGALDQAAVALALWDAGRETIQDMFRAESLCPLAEAYAVMGETERAAQVYRTAIEEGALNANARPRAMSLVGTCCSMATHGFEPDTELLTHIRKIRAGLHGGW